MFGSMGPRLGRRSGRVSARSRVKTVVGTTKSAKGRAIALDQGLVAVLRAHRVAQNGLRLLMGTGWRDLDLVFPNLHGDYQAPETVSRVFRELNDRLGLPPIRLHDLRHGWATLALESNVHPKVVQERLGHANIAITMDIYSHVTPGMHDAAAETVALIRGS